MQKRTRVILAFVAILVATLSIFLQYFGVTRYVHLHFVNPENYIKSYPKLEKAGKKTDRVVVTVAVASEDIDSIKPLIASLLDQTVKVDEIAINLIGNPGPQPVYLKKSTGLIEVYQTPNRFGIGSGIIPTLIREKNSGTKIIEVDGAVIFGKDFIEHLVDQSNTHPGKVIVSKGAVLVTPDMFKTATLKRVIPKGGLRNSVYSHGMWVKEGVNEGVKVHHTDYRENYTTWRSRKNVMRDELLRMALEGVVRSDE